MGDDELPLGAHHRRSRQHFRGRRAPTIVEIASAIVSGAGRSRAGWHCRGRRAPSDRSTLSRAPGAYGRTWPGIDAGAGRSQAGCRRVHGELLPLHGEYVSAGHRAPSFSRCSSLLYVLGLRHMPGSSRVTDTYT